VINRPVAFAGSEAQRAVNRATHHFCGEDARCIECDCRSFGVYADWPCGADVPRESVTRDTAPNSALAALARGRA